MDGLGARPLALIGSMGAGKSAVARRLGEVLGVVVADLDAALAADAGCSVTELFAREGEAAFRRREAAQLAGAIAGGARVIACGGGIVVSEACRALLREACDTCWLEVAPAEAARRLAAAGESEIAARPLLAGGEPAARLAALLAERAPLYAAVARWRLATDGLAPGTIAERVLAIVRGGAA